MGGYWGDHGVVSTPRNFVNGKQWLVNSLLNFFLQILGVSSSLWLSIYWHPLHWLHEKFHPGFVEVAPLHRHSDSTSGRGVWVREPYVSLAAWRPRLLQYVTVRATVTHIFENFMVVFTTFIARTPNPSASTSGPPWFLFFQTHVVQ